MQKILITGGAGNVGSCLAIKLLETNLYEIVIVDNLLTGDYSKIPEHPKCKFIKCDVNDYSGLSAIMIGYSFDYVFHYAAVVGVKRTLENPIMVLNDIQGIKNILSLCKNTGVKRIFYSSSSEVYGEPVEFPQNEDTTPLNSRLPYAIVKNIGEAYCKSYYQEYGLNYTVFRFFNTYGPHQSTDFVISKFMKLAVENKPITIYGDGSQTRTFCYIDDNINASIKCLTSNLHINDTVNIGSDIEISILELAKLIIKITDSKSEIIHLPPLKEGDMTRRKPDLTKMKALLPSDMISLESGIRKVLDQSNLFKELKG